MNVYMFMYVYMYSCMIPNNDAIKIFRAPNNVNIYVISPPVSYMNN